MTSHEDLVVVDSAKVAHAKNQAFVTRLEKRASLPDAVSRACLYSYIQRLSDNTDEHPLHDLTRHLTGTSDETQREIRRRMTAKWEGHPTAAQKIESSVTNSMRRSAGTNYQGLVSYAIAAHLASRQSSWYVVHPVPDEWAHMLSIAFTGGIEPHASEDDLEVPIEVRNSVSVKPDLDILIRNAGWEAGRKGNEPVLLLSVKTSLADRAGSAARWKTYFDLVSKPCEYACEDLCAYQRLGITLANAPAIHITHGIVTANIYKVNSDPYFARYGELRSNQSRANTFMFDQRYTTREESAEVMADGWESLIGLVAWLAETSAEYDIPS